MPTKPLQLIIDPPQAGAWNMAVDEALLDAAVEGEVTLRVYEWSEPTLSVGYFQAYDERETHAASRELPCVRRHSGGGAIVHDRELTYSLALPAAMLPAGGPTALYNAAHSALVKLIEDQTSAPSGGLELCDPSGGSAAEAEPFLCFHRRSEGDVLITRRDGDDKVIGSAQRKRRGAVLQHGSVLLSRSDAAPELPGITDLLGDPGVDAERLAEALSAAMGISGEVSALPGPIRDSAERIAAQRYADDGWTRRR